MPQVTQEGTTVTQVSRFLCFPHLPRASTPALTPSLLSAPYSPPPAATLEPSCCCSPTASPFPPQNFGSCHFLCLECSSASSLHCQVLLRLQVFTQISPHQRETPDHPTVTLSRYPVPLSVYHFHSLESSYFFACFSFPFICLFRQTLNPIRWYLMALC